MRWRQVKRRRWELAEDGFSGQSMIKETNHGFIASIQVRNEDFDMELLSEREFFESRKDALRFLKKRMARDSY